MARLRSTDRLLVRLPSWLGDFVMAEPAMAALAARLRSGRLERLAFAAPERFFDLLQGRFEGVERLTDESDWSGFDVALLLDGSLRSVLRARRAGIRERWGWTHGGRALLLLGGLRPALERGATPLGLGVHGRGARRLPRPFGAACNELVGLCGEAVVDRAPQLASAPGPRAALATRLRSFGLAPGEPYLALDASARPASAKGAPAALWAEALEAPGLAGLPPIVLLTAPGEGAIARDLHALLDTPRVHLYDDPAPTLGELLAAIEGAQAFLGTDSGPRHLATASARPQLILVGPTDPRHTADHNRATQLVRIDVDCGPCHLERCPLEGARAGHCMSAIPSNRIVEALRRLLG